MYLKWMSCTQCHFVLNLYFIVFVKLLTQLNVLLVTV